MPAEEILVVLSTFPDAKTARRIAEKLVAENLTACANITTQIESVYRWQGKVETGKEALVLFKLPSDRYAAFERELKAIHPYEIPEIIALRVTRGSPEYLRWIRESCGT